MNIEFMCYCSVFINMCIVHMCPGDPVLSHLERHTAEFALRLHAGADEREHVRALLHAVCVAGGGRRPELQPRLQHLQGNTAGCSHSQRTTQWWRRTRVLSQPALILYIYRKRRSVMNPPRLRNSIRTHLRRHSR